MSQNKNAMIRRLNVLSLVSVLLFSLLLFWIKTSAFTEMLRLIVALIEFIIISKFLISKYKSKIKIVIYVSILLILIKIFDGIFLHYNFRFFTDVMILFWGGLNLLQNKYQRITFNEMALILYAPLSIIFLPLVFDDRQFSLAVSLSIPISLALLWFHQNSNYKILVKGLALLIFVGLSFIFLPNYLHYKNGEQLEPSQSANSFSILPLITQNIDTISIAQMGNKIVILDVWYSGCGVCFKKFLEFDAFAKEYVQDTNLYVASLNIPLAKELDTFNSFVLVKEYSFNKLQATSTTVENKWGIE